MAQSDFCPNCGSEISTKHTYCMICGKKIPKNDLTLKRYDNNTYKLGKRSAWNSRIKDKKYLVCASLLAIIIIGSVVFIIGPLIIDSLGLGPYNYLGTTIYTVDITPVTELKLRIDCLSPINISFREDLEVLLEAKIIVYGKLGRQLENSDKFEGALENDTYIVRFEPYYSDVVPKGYDYELCVNISTHILTSLEVDSGYGDLYIEARGANISNAMLGSSWGLVTAYFEETSISSNEGLYIDNTKASINVTLVNMSYSENNTYWVISSFEGNVSVGIHQGGLLERIQNVTFRITAEGEVLLKHSLSSSIGYMIENAFLIEVDFNFIGYPPTVLLPYFSENYSSTPVIYKFELAGMKGVTVISLS